MGSLFLKIFFWFWATVIVTGCALILTFIVEPRNVPSRWHATLTDTARYAGAVAVETAERNGAASASAYLARIKDETHITACLFDTTGAAIAGGACTEFQDMAPHVEVSKTSNFSMKYGIARVALMVSGPSGRDYIFATELPAGPRAALGINRTALVLQWGVALLVSGLICWSLTRYITAPVLRLQEMSRQLATGDLSVRADPGLVARRDEIGNLVRDFNGMAYRIEELISGQRRLISDISHELRSPLARLSVALDLGRQRKGDDAAFVQMEEDIQLLDEMIGRLLTVAKLDITTPQVHMADIDLTDLISSVAHNAEFEAQNEDRGIAVSVFDRCIVRGSEELLRSAIENVVRNAIRYTAENTSVELQLRCESSLTGKLARLVVRDHGPGVPDAELMNIFQPFYRVTGARDRVSGGAGLGLAIADRVIRAHRGTIQAMNAEPDGLSIEIVLPQRETGQIPRAEHP